VSIVLLLRLLSALHHPIAGVEAEDVLAVARNDTNGGGRATQSSSPDSDDSLRRNNVFQGER